MGTDNKHIETDFPWGSFLTALVVILKEWKVIFKYYNKVKPWGKKQRRTEVSEEKKRQALEIMAELGYKHGFHRITVAIYEYDKMPVNEEDYKDLRITIIYEWKQKGVSGIQDQFQNEPAGILGKDIKKLQDNPRGFIMIDGNSSVQNMWQVKKSWRFKMDGHVVNGSVTFSYMYEEDIRHLDDDDLQEMYLGTKQIYLIENK